MSRTSSSTSRRTRRRGTLTASAVSSTSRPPDRPGASSPKGGIRRDATLGLAALRLLFAGKDTQKTIALRRYILGLALTAFTHHPTGYLRQGCLLVLDPDKPREFVEVYPSGERRPAAVMHEAALAFAKRAAAEFGVGEDRAVEFDKERAKKDVAGEGETKTKGKKAKKSESGGAS